MGEVVDLPGARSRWFADERGRSLRATWHPESGLIVLSLWNADDCVGTFRLSTADASELVALIAQANPELREHASDGYSSSRAIGP
jgi:hypothetical protein